MSEKTPKEWLDKIEEERKKGNVCFLTYEGLMSMPLAEFIKQPTEGILYDLNRLPEVVATWIKEDKKWVNDYAVGTTIRYLAEQNEFLKTQLDNAIEELKNISLLEHTGACDPDDPPQEDCGVCIAQEALKKLE